MTLAAHPIPPAARIRPSASTRMRPGARRDLDFAEQRIAAGAEARDRLAFAAADDGAALVDAGTSLR